MSARGLAGWKPLRLFAADPEDLTAISALTQDAVARLGDFAFLPAERRFAVVLNRFLWEAADAGPPYGRARTGLHFDDVRAARRLRLRDNAPDAVVELLALRCDPGPDGTAAIRLDFAGGGAIALEAESVNAELRDLAGPWPARSRPRHED